MSDAGGTRRWIAPLAALLLALGLPGCGTRSEEHGHEHEDEHGGAEHDDQDQHDEDGSHAGDGDAGAGEEGAEAGAGEQEGAHEGESNHVPLAGVRGVSFGEVSPPVEEGIWYPGEAMASELERAMLTSPIAGTVEAIAVPPGREVGRGTPLLTLRSPELAALAADLLKSGAVREQAAAEVAREERLAAAGAGALRELEAARAALAVARADESAARLALEARGIAPGDAGATLDVSAPYRGRVASVDVAIGEGVEGGQRLGMFETASASLVHVELPLPGPSAWSPGVETTVRRGDGKTWTARVEGLPASLSAETRRLTYRLRLEGARDLPYPGTPLEVRVPLPAGIVVPQDAVQQIEGEWGVFVIEGDVAHFTAIRRGPELGGDVIVLEGLAPGQRIAIEGAYLLKALALKRSGGGEAHAH
jgi:cobalt-zinc-cadmium efflux system membrane fusion protein